MQKTMRESVKVRNLQKMRRSIFTALVTRNTFAINCHKRRGFDCHVYLRFFIYPVRKQGRCHPLPMS